MLFCALLPCLLLCQIPVVVSWSRELPFQDDERSLYEDQIFNSYLRSPREVKQGVSAPKSAKPSRGGKPASLSSGNKPSPKITVAKDAKLSAHGVTKPPTTGGTSSKPSVTPHTQLTHLLSVDDKTNLLKLIDSVSIIDKQMKALSNRQTLVPGEPNAADKESLVHVQKAFVTIQMDLKAINVNNRKTVSAMKRNQQDNEKLEDIKAQFDNIKAYTERIMNRGTLFSTNKEPQVLDENNILRMKGELEIIDGILNSMEIKSKSSKRKRPSLSVEDKQHLLKLSDAAKMSSSQFDYLLTRGTFVHGKISTEDKAALAKIKNIFKAITYRINKIDPENRKTSSKTSVGLSRADKAVLPSIKRAVYVLRREIAKLSKRATLIPNGKKLNVEDEDNLIRIRSGIGTMVSILEQLAVTSGGVSKSKVAASKPKVAASKSKIEVSKPKVAVSKPKVAVSKPKVRRGVRQAPAIVPKILIQSNTSNTANTAKTAKTGETTKTKSSRPPLSVKDKTHLLTVQKSMNIISYEINALGKRQTLTRTVPNIADKASVSRIKNSLGAIQRYLTMLDINNRKSIVDTTADRNKQDGDFIKQIISDFAIINNESQAVKTRGTLFSQKEPSAKDEASLLRIKGEMENIDTILQTLAPKTKVGSRPPLSISTKSALLKLNDAAKTAVSEFGKLQARRLQSEIPVDDNDKVTVSKINEHLKKIQAQITDIDVENRNTAFSKTKGTSKEDTASLMAIKSALKSLRDQVDILANRNTFFQKQAHLIVGDQNSLIRFKISMDAMDSMLKKLVV